MNAALRDYIQSHILPLYEGVDPAHGLSHIQKVTENSMRLAAMYPVDEDMVFCVASYHDVGIRHGRENHEKTSADFLRRDANLTQFFSPEQIEEMAKAVEDHRASSDHEPRSIYGRIIAEADRDIEPARIIERCITFSMSHNPDASEEEIIAIALDHLKDKYGSNGYLKLYLHDPRNEEGLATLRRYMSDGSMAEIVGKETKKHFASKK